MKLMHIHQLEILYLVYRVKGQTEVIKGHRGQKAIFTKNCIIRPCNTAWPWNSYICITLWPAICDMGQRSIEGHIRSQGSKGHFGQKINISTIRHSMTMSLMHMHQPETFYLWYGSKVNHRSTCSVATKRNGRVRVFAKTQSCLVVLVSLLL